jgi:alpha-mannosidase
VYVIDQCYGPLRQRISYYMCFEGSRLDVSVTLDAGSDRLDISVKADWHELGGYPKGVPLLRMPVNIGYEHDTYRYLTAGGYVDRPAIAYDVPSLGVGCAVAWDGVSLAVLSDCKYGFRGWDDTMSVSLLRSAYEPDPCPDQGIHYIHIALQPVSAEGAELEYAAARQMHPVLSCVLPVEEDPDVKMTDSLLTISGGNLVAVKKSEDGKALVLRLTNPSEQENTVQISLSKQVLRAYTVDLREIYCQELPCTDNVVTVSLAANSICSVAIELEESGYVQKMD